MRRLGLVLVFASLWAALPASAQSIRLDQYRMAQTPTDGFALSRPNDHGHLSFGVRLDVDYALNPLVYQLRASDSETEISPVVEHLLAAQLGVSFSLFERIVLFVGLPVHLVMEGSLVDGQPRADGASLGDFGFGVRGRLFGEEGDVFALALQVSGTAPTAQAARFQSRFAGEGDWTIHPELLFEIRIAEIVRITGNAGALVREEQDFGRLRVGHELTWGGALSVAVVPDVFELTAESWGASALDARFGDAQVSPIELMLGLRVLPVEGMTIGAGAGTGVARGYGAGDFRAVFTLGYATPGEQPSTDRDGDGLNDDVDQCPDDPEDADGFEDDDGCPDPDNDRDGILDASDACPTDPEDLDGLGDEDGCPETDFDGDTVLDVTDRCPTVAGMVSAPRADCEGCPTCDEEPPPPEPEPLPPTEPAPSIAPRVLFDVGRHELRPSERAALQEILAALRAHPNASVMIEGHADFRGQEPDNVVLSRQRARQVVVWLFGQGIERSRMIGVGCGEAYPIEENVTRRGRQANRRVEVRSPEGVRPGCTPIVR